MERNSMTDLDSLDFLFVNSSRIHFVESILLNTNWALGLQNALKEERKWLTRKLREWEEFESWMQVKAAKVHFVVRNFSDKKRESEGRVKSKSKQVLTWLHKKHVIRNDTRQLCKAVWDSWQRLYRRNGLDMKWDGDEPRMTWKSRGKIETRRRRPPKPKEMNWYSSRQQRENIRMTESNGSCWTRDYTESEGHESATKSEWQGEKGTKRGRRDKNRTFLLLHSPSLQNREERNQNQQHEPLHLSPLHSRMTRG